LRKCTQMATEVQKSASIEKNIQSQKSRYFKDSRSGIQILMAHLKKISSYLRQCSIMTKWQTMASNDKKEQGNEQSLKTRLEESEHINTSLKVAYELLLEQHKIVKADLRKSSDRNRDLEIYLEVINDIVKNHERSETIKLDSIRQVLKQVGKL